MKRDILMLFVGALTIGTATAQKAQEAQEVQELPTNRVIKETHIYSIKKCDTLRLDRYFTNSDIKAKEPKPVIIFLFGGAFYTGTRNEPRFTSCFEYYAKRGYQVVSIDYRLALKNFKTSDVKSISSLVNTIDNTINVAVEDLYDATSYLAKKSEEWNINPKKFVTFGSSAGAITTLQAEYYIVNGHQLTEKLPANFKYAGVMAMAGAIFSKSGKISWSDKAAPMLLFQGNADKNVPYSKARVFSYGLWGCEQVAKSLSKISSPYYFYTFDNETHTVAISPMDDNREDIDIFLTKFVENREPLEITKTQKNTSEPIRKKNFGIRDYLKANFPSN